MELIAIVDRIIEDIKRNPFLVLSENDLACRIYQELAKDASQRVFTEWSVKEKSRFSGTRIGRCQYDMVVCDRDAIAYEGKNDINIKFYRKVIELKVHWQTSGQHMFNKMEEGDFRKLSALTKDVAEKKYMIAFNLYSKDVNVSILEETRKKWEAQGIVFIYRFLDTRSLMRTYNPANGG